MPIVLLLSLLLRDITPEVGVTGSVYCAGRTARHHHHHESHTENSSLSVLVQLMPLLLILLMSLASSLLSSDPVYSLTANRLGCHTHHRTCSTRKHWKKYILVTLVFYRAEIILTKSFRCCLRLEFVVTISPCVGMSSLIFFYFAVNTLTNAWLLNCMCRTSLSLTLLVSIRAAWGGSSIKSRRTTSPPLGTAAIRSATTVSYTNRVHLKTHPVGSTWIIGEVLG